MTDQDPNNPNTFALDANTSVNQGIRAKVQQVVAAVRVQMRDFEHLNRLTAGVESSDKQIAFAMSMALDEFNITPPLLTPHNIESFPSISLLVRGTIIWLLQGLGLLSTRNSVAYSDGNTHLNLDKTREIQAWLSMYTASYQMQIRQLKVSMNLNGALGDAGISSEYATIHNLYDYVD